MGPLSGAGNPDRYVLHEGRIYIFASDACKATFLRNPAAFLVRRVERPRPDRELGSRARILLGKAIESAGGEKRLMSLKSLRLTYKVTYGSGAQEASGQREIVLGFPGTMRFQEKWSEIPYGWLARKRDGFEFGRDGAYRVEAIVLWYMRREMYQHPLALLHAWRQGAALVGSISSEGGINRVTLIVDGTSNTLGIDSDTGRIVDASFSRMGSAGMIEYRESYSDYRDVEGLRVPFGLKASINGQAVSNPRVVCESARVNVTEDLKSLQHVSR
jgi:hypothetical protein